MIRPIVDHESSPPFTCGTESSLLFRGIEKGARDLDVEDWSTEENDKEASDMYIGRVRRRIAGEKTLRWPFLSNKALDLDITMNSMMNNEAVLLAVIVDRLCTAEGSKAICFCIGDDVGQTTHRR